MLFISYQEKSPKICFIVQFAVSLLQSNEDMLYLEEDNRFASIFGLRYLCIRKYNKQT